MSTRFYFNVFSCIVEKWKMFNPESFIELFFMCSYFYAECNSHQGQYTQGDKLQQHVTATHHSNKLLHVYWIIFVKIFVPATRCTNSVSFDFLRLVAATKFCSRDKDFHKNLDSSTHEMICCGNVLLQLFAGPIHKEWFAMATFCWNLSPSVFEPLVTTWHKPKKVKK